MPAKRILYFTASQVRAYSWQAGALVQDRAFENGETTPPEFDAYVAEAPLALYYLLVDIVEEDFHLETIPYVRGGDRRTLLQRKLAQRYRDLTLALTLSLGYESGPRKEENILFSSFTNTQQLQPWIIALEQKEARMAGVYSVPLVAPVLASRMGFPQKRFLLVSRQHAGIRQTFIDNGQIRFSRLGQIEGDDMAQRANALSVETVRLQQYLINMRMLPREGGPLDVIVVVPDQALAQFEAACVSTTQLTFHLVTLTDACKRVGQKSAPDGLLAERLYLHVLAGWQPAAQFAVDELRRFYNIWRARNAAYTASAAFFFVCACIAGLRLYDFYNVQTQASSDQTQERKLNEQYARLQARFPKTPTTTENLKALVKNYIVLQHQTVSMEKMLVEISTAMTTVPQIQIDRIEWQLSANPGRSPASASAAKAAEAAPANAAAPAKPDQDPLYEVVQLSGVVNAAQASDFRNITRLVNQFTDALRARPGLEVVSTQLPFDLTAEKNITGDIGAAREAEIPRFTIVLNKRVES
ncbi:MAG: hypothetical protein ACKVQK_01050 [Burkholderiales bacterium]